MKPGIALIGPGKLGCALTHLLSKAGYPIVAVIGRDRQRASEACEFIGCAGRIAGSELSSAKKAEILLLAVPDDQIPNLAQQLHDQAIPSEATTLVHFSGLHPAGIMRAGQSATAVLSIHPLLPFADRRLAVEQLPGCPCAIEGDKEAEQLGLELVAAFDGRAFSIKSDKKALYHAAACIASNYFVTLVAAATELLHNCGIDPKEATQLLLPLLQATLANIDQLGTEQGLTGPIVRGDAGTVTAHLKALENSAPRLLPAYRLLAEQTLHLAKVSGRLTAQQAESILKAL